MSDYQTTKKEEDICQKSVHRHKEHRQQKIVRDFYQKSCHLGKGEQILQETN